MVRLFIVIGIAALAACAQTNDNPSAREKGSCHISGCSAQVCSERDDIATTCEWRDVYECYRSATCEQQADGACGWTPTQELDACLEQHAPAS